MASLPVFHRRYEGSRQKVKMLPAPFFWWPPFNPSPVCVQLFLTCSSRLLQCTFLSPSSGSGLSCFFCPWESRCLIYLLKSVPCFRKPQLPGNICSRVVVWGCGAVPPLQPSSQTRLPGEITRLRGDFPLP